MTHIIKLIDLGDEGAFLPLPDEVLAHMNLKLGDELIVKKDSNGFTLSPASKK
ncbi:MAG: AbrB/MazE/SpoVT family DNA-binding domain-containing protein [Casimicrobium sp.]